MLLAEGDPEVAEDEERLIEEFRRQLELGMWAAVPHEGPGGRREATMVRARSVDGELGILPGHTPLLGVLVSGDVVIHGEGGEQTTNIDSGFISVEHDRVTIIAESVGTAGQS